MPDGTPFLIESTEPRDPSWEELSLDRACGIGAAGARLGESRTGLGDATPVLVRILIRTT